MATTDPNKVKPSRVETILMAMLGESVEIDEPKSRVEELLLQLKEAIEQGGGSGFAPTQEQLDAMNSGIDSTKVAQIATNKNNILSKANTSDVNTATANLQAQINNIITPVTQDAEVENARIGSDGTSYQTLKGRLDAEYKALTDEQTNLKEDLNGTSNLFFINPVYGFVNSVGDIQTAGANDNQHTSDFINVGTNKTFTLTSWTMLNERQKPWLAIGFYDAEKNFIKRITKDTYDIKNGYAVCSLTITTTAHTLYLRASSNIQNNAIVLFQVGNFIPEYPPAVRDFYAPKDQNAYTKIIPSSDGYISINTSAKTVLIPSDTMIVDSRIGNATNTISLERQEVSYKSLLTTAIILVCDLSNSALKWKAWNSKVEENEAIILTFRTISKAVSSSTPVYVDDKLFGLVDVSDDAKPVFTNPYCRMTLPNSGFPIINSTLKKITIPAGTTMIDGRLFGNQTPIATDTEVSFDGLTSTSIELVYNLKTKVFSWVNAGTALSPKEYIVICSYKTISKTVVAPCPIYVDGLIYGIPLSNPFAKIMPAAAGINVSYPTIDTSKRIIKIPNDTLILDARLPRGYVTLPYSEVSYSELTTAAIQLIYNTASNQLTWERFDKVLTNSDIAICTFRTVSKSVNSAGTIFVDGKVSGINNIPENKFVKAISHRGFNSIAPENTLSAFRLSKRMGFDAVECDVCLTKDKIPVIIHDGTVDRTSDGTGDVRNMTFDQVRELDFGTWKSPAYAGEKIPSFEEYMLLCRNLGLESHVEIKSDDFTTDDLQNLLAITKRNGMLEHTWWCSFHYDYLTTMINLDKSCNIVYLNDLSESALNEALTFRTEKNKVAFNANYPTITQGMVDRCIDEGMPLGAYTIPNETTARQLNPYVSFATCDNTVFGRALLEGNIL